MAGSTDSKQNNISELTELQSNIKNVVNVVVDLEGEMQPIYDDSSKIGSNTPQLSGGSEKIAYQDTVALEFTLAQAEEEGLISSDNHTALSRIGNHQGVDDIRKITAEAEFPDGSKSPVVELDQDGKLLP